MRRPEPSALLLAAGFVTFYYAVYALAAVSGDGWGPRHHLYLAWEPSIPLLPWLAPLYMSVDLMAIPVLLLYPTVPELRTLVLVLLAELALAVLVFWLYPLEDGFPPCQATGMLALTRSLYLRHNYFPSLHVALAFSLAAAMARRSRYGAAAFVWAGGVALSTLFLHAHHLADVVAGMALAWLGMGPGFRYLSGPCASFKEHT